VSFSPIPSLNVNLRERWRSSLRPNLTTTQYYNVDVASVAYTDLNLGYKVPGWGGDHEIFLNVQNLFDKAPPVYGGGDLGWTYQDDPIGRYVTVGVRGKF
jgi:outer membrane receptor protein involved in Fe transport